MNKPTSLKSRIDVVDTTLLKQQEKHVLKVLIILLCLTIVYEFAPPEWYQGLLSTPAASTGTAAPTRARVFPAKRLGGLKTILASLTRELPVARVYLTTSQERLASLSFAITGAKSVTHTQTLTVPFLQELYRFSHLPVWADPEPFLPLRQELQQLLTLLGAPAMPSSGMPRLEFGPRLLTTAQPPQRNLFAYPGPAPEQTPEP
jgi:hypothetical protein